jgi:hypothetical protein
VTGQQLKNPEFLTRRITQMHALLLLWVLSVDQTFISPMALAL